MHLVQLDQVIVARKIHGLMRRVVDQVMCGAVADAVQRNGRLIHPINAAVMMNMVVVGREIGLGQRFAITPAQRDAAVAHVIHVASDHAAVAARQGKGRRACVANRTADDPHINRIIDHQRRTSADFHEQAGKRDVRRIFHCHKRWQHRHGRSALLDGCRRPEIEDALRAIEIPFAGLIEFRQQVVGVVPLPIAESKGVLRLSLKRNYPLFKIDRFDLEPLIGPIPEPVTFEHDVGLANPAPGPVALVRKNAVLTSLRAAAIDRDFPQHFGNLHKTLVRPSGKRRGRVLEEQLEAGRRLPPSLPRAHFAQVGDALGFQIGLQHFAPGRLVELAQNGRVRNRLPTIDHSAAEQTDFLALASPINDRRTFHARIFSREHKRRSQFIKAGA